jgi:hypothetical protein
MPEKGFNSGAKKIIYCIVNHLYKLCYIIIIIVIIILHQLGLDRPVSA